MGTYQYEGLTAYVNQNDGSTSKLRALAEIFYQFERWCYMEHPVPAAHDQTVASAAFKYLEENTGIFSQDASAFPQNTPAAFTRVTVEPVQVDGQRFIRMYFPAVQKNEDRVHQAIHESLIPVLKSLFGHDLVTLKTQTADEFQEFANAAKNVLMAVKTASRV